jgi:uncharacterized protein (TIGR03083 family)
MDRDILWQHVDREREALADTLASLSEQQWQAASLCAGWTVENVAVHVVTGPQIRLREMPAMFGRGRFSYDRSIAADAVRRTAEWERPAIVSTLRSYSRRRARPTVVTPTETLIDALVHHQDILRPLGRRHSPAPEAAAVAADRSRLLAPLVGSTRIVRSVRMVATDLDWSRGRGPVVEGAMLELLMLCAGRASAARDLAGAGAGLVAAAAGPRSG